MAVRLNDHLYFKLASSVIRTKRINNTPWIIPTTRTGSGLPAMYFIGMAIKSSASKDKPSIKLEILSLPIVDLNMEFITGTKVFQ